MSNLNLSLPFGQAPLTQPAAGRNPLLRQDASLEKVVEQMEAMQQREGGPITAIRHQPAREAKLVALPPAVDDRLRDVLARRDIVKLYSHQGEAFDKIAAGENVVIVTPTASGKTLCYNLPVLNSLLADQQSCALYLFPSPAPAGVLSTLEKAADVKPPEGTFMFTGGDVHPGGRGVLLRTYTHLFFYPLASGEPLEAAFGRPPCDLYVAPEMQGEAIAFRAAADGYLSVSEGQGSSLHRVLCGGP